MGGWERTKEPGIYKRDGARGRRYRVMYRDAAGNQIVRNFPSFEDAKEHRRRSTGIERPESAKGTRRTLRELYEEQTAARAYAHETLVTRRSASAYLEPWWDVQAAKITPATVRKIEASVSSASMRGKVRDLLSVMFDFAIEHRDGGWGITTNPVTRRRKRRTRAERLAERSVEDRKRYLSNDELARLLEALPEGYRALVELMARMGLRPGEAYALRVAKLDPLRRTLLIDTSVSGFTKTGEPRTLQLPGPIADMLIEHLNAFSKPKDPDALMFTTESGAPIDPDNFRRRVFATAVREAGIGGTLSPNLCRHTAAAFAISTGANIYDVQRMLGHAKPSITLDVYGSLFEEQHSKFVERYGRAIKKARATRPQTADVVALHTR